MGQKINPVSLRLHYTNRKFDNCWYSNYFYRKLLTRDIFLQDYLNNFLKLLKLPTGRYSIQHLQKKTQVYNFLCYSKSTREWRSKLFGLTKNVSKKTRYFFKNTTGYKKRNKKTSKLQFLYRNLNQIRVHKIQKRITSFQNFRLWSAVVFSKNTLRSYHNFSILNKLSPLSHNKDFSNPLSTIKSFPLSTIKSYAPSFSTRKFIIRDLLKKVILSPLLIQKITKLSNNPNSLSDLKKLNNKLVSNKQNQELQNLSLKNNWNFFICKQVNNSNLLFLKNLFLYKILKTRLKLKTSKKDIIHKSTKELSQFSSVNKISQDLSRSFFVSQKMSNPSCFNTLNYKYNNYLESSLSSFYKLDFHLMSFKVKNDWQNASYLADEIVYFLQKRIPFRRLKSKLLRQLSKIEAIRGVRITCSGRVGGKSKKAQRAKMECIKYGQTSLQVFSSKIDFSVKTAFTSFGSVGVKVWICYN